MRMAWCLHAVRRVTVCSLLVLGSLILWGCGEDASVSDAASGASDGGVSSGASELSGEALLAAQAPFYVAVDAAFPDGKPGLTSVEERAGDAAYNAHRAELRAQKAELEAAAKQARLAADAYRELQLEILWKNLGEAPLPEVLEARLAQDDHYQGLVRKAEAAEAAVSAKQAELAEVIQARRYADVARYTELKAAADAAAVAAGLPARADRESVVAKAEEAPKSVAEVQDVKDLSKETGIPVAPSAP